MLASRDAIVPEERRRRSRAIAERVAALPEIVAASMVLFYWPMGSEVDPLHLIGLLPVGIALALPRVVGPKIVPITYTPGDPLSPTRLGPEEPSMGSPVDPAELGAVLVPGVAFDPAGRRVGYGGGFYDRFAGSLPETTPRIALAYELQILPEVPNGIFDRRVDLLVTEERVIRP